jgi:hypothetical protein
MKDFRSLHSGLKFSITDRDRALSNEPQPTPTQARVQREVNHEWTGMNTKETAALGMAGD